jgi:hypothetical protein
MTRSHTASGIFRDMDHAEDAQQYLLAQEFTEDDIEITPTGNGNQITLKITGDSAIILQEAVDVLRNYGAVDISMTP